MLECLEGDKFIKQQDRRFSAEPYISQVVCIDRTSRAFAVMARFPSNLCSYCTGLHFGFSSSSPLVIKHIIYVGSSFNLTTALDIFRKGKEKDFCLLLLWVRVCVYFSQILILGSAKQTRSDGLWDVISLKKATRLVLLKIIIFH